MNTELTIGGFPPAETEESIKSEGTEYVLGFLFDTHKERVVLIEKQKPAWQRGFLNGVGGKIEPGELPAQAMRREFREETGLDVDFWELFCTLSGNWGRIYIFQARVLYPEAAKTTEIGRVGLYYVRHLPASRVIPNVRWLLQMAISFGFGERAKRFVVREIS